MTSRRFSSSRPSDPSSNPQQNAARVERSGARDAKPTDASSTEVPAKARRFGRGANNLAEGSQSREGRSSTSRRPASTQRPHVPVAMGWGALSALGTMLLLAVPVFLGWALAARTSSSWNQTLGVTIDLWALAHRAHVHSTGTVVVFSPLALTLLCVLGARFGAKRSLPVQRLSAPDLRAVLGGFVIGYVLMAQVLGVLSSLGSNTINPMSLILGPAVVAAVGVAWATWRERRNSPELAALDEAVVDATPMLAKRSIRAAVHGLRLFGLLTLVLFLVLVAWHGQRIWAVQSHLHPGAVGGVLLVLGQLTALPNMLALVAGWTAGAPVHFGDVVVGHSGMAAGTLPMIPVLGAVPQGGMYSWSWVFASIPLIVGGFIGWDASGAIAKLSSLRAKLIVSTCAAALATVAMWFIWWFSTASVSTGVLSYVGPGWTAWLYLPVEFLISAAVLAGVRHWVMNHRP